MHPKEFLHLSEYLIILPNLCLCKKLWIYIYIYIQLLAGNTKCGPEGASSLAKNLKFVPDLRALHLGLNHIY